ncbi:MAG: acetyl-CoA C-acyltransferase [Bacteroidota bacterium]
MSESRNVVVVDGARTPFLRSGTDYMDLMSYQLGHFAVKGLLTKTGIDPAEVGHVVMGTVISNLKTSNVARESAVMAGIPNKTPCHTVTMACISANQAIAQAYNLIKVGKADVAVAGGVDNTSDTPIAFRRQMRKKLFKAQKLRGAMDSIKFLFKLRPKDFLPERPRVAEYITNRVMGEDCDILAAKYGVTRAEQDAFAVRSHHLAHQAWEDGHLADEVSAVAFPPRFKTVTRDNGIRPDTSVDRIKKLRPAFDRKFGTLTAANSSFLTDGAACVLLMEEKKALELGYQPKARIVDYAFTGQDLYDELLLGPAYATSKLLAETGLDLDQMDVIEFHEAFAGQILANIKCLGSDEFAQAQLGREKAVGKVNMDKFNRWGGSLSLGHPFGATGARLVTTASNRLQKENGKYALVAACAAGALGHAMILEKYTS